MNPKQAAAAILIASFPVQLASAATMCPANRVIFRDAAKGLEFGVERVALEHTYLCNEETIRTTQARPDLGDCRGPFGDTAFEGYLNGIKVYAVSTVLPGTPCCSWDSFSADSAVAKKPWAWLPPGQGPKILIGSPNWTIKGDDTTPLTGPLGGGTLAPHRCDCTEVGGSGMPTFLGKLTHHIFPGPPGYQDVRKGDTPEPGYRLTLRQTRCVKAPGDEVSEPTEIDHVQVLPAPDHADGVKASELRRYIGRDVSITGGNGSGGHTAPRRALWVITAVRVQPVEVSTASYGTAQSTVEAFYHALEIGDGAAASSMMVPGKRSGPFDPAAISTFYGRLTEPLKLISVSPSGPNTYETRYTFVAGKRRCDGRSTVKTARVGELNMIASIRAPNGC